jgi:NADPH2:quinone reductase
LVGGFVVIAVSFAQVVSSKVIFSGFQFRLYCFSTTNKSTIFAFHFELLRIMNTSALFLIANTTPEKAFDLREMQLPTLKNDEVLIEVCAFGLNYADVMARKGLYRDAPPLPCVLGYEVVGTINQVGSSNHEGLLGQRVVAFTRFGGYAKHTITKIDAIMPIDNEINSAAALALTTQYLTAYYMVYIATNILQGDHVLVHAAAGGVGTALIQMLKERGAVVYAKCGSDSKKDYVMSQGADFFINYNQNDYIQTLQSQLNGNKLDVSMNPVAGATFKKDMQLLRPGGGRILLFGGSDLTNAKWGMLSQLNFVRKMGFFTPIILMMKSQSIIGVNMLRIADNNPNLMRACIQGVSDLYQKGVLKPQVGAEFQAAELAEAHAFLESGKSVGKIAVLW